MQNFTYQVPIRVHLSTKLPITDEKGNTIFLMQKQRHRFLASIFNGILRYGLPFCYQIANISGQPLYIIDCVFPGFRYKLIEHVSSQTIPITRHKVQLIENAYSFTIANQNYYFEKDYTGAGHLKCDDEQIATVSMPVIKKSSMIDTINVQAATEEIAPLAAVMFHTFYYYNA
ncbi:hypothetical protein [Neobacillus sp. NPDC093127]|uniref:tubby C-terminal domain-like protein n=1 Tax=Neobacillus sp. NPDC093127 TaxID=3364296 RepID=UPI0037FB7AEE